MNQKQLQFEEMTEQEFDNISVKSPATSKPSVYDALLEQIIDGKIISANVPENELKGFRIGVSRRASSAFSIKLQFKYDAAKKVLAIRLAGEKAETTEKKPVGRPPKR
jgi:hypothetical protein